MNLLYGILTKLSIVILLSFSCNTAIGSSMALPGCAKSCGNTKVPYPFGIGDKCYLEEKFKITCDNSSGSTPKARLGTSNINVTSISLSDSELRVLQYIAKDCYNQMGVQTENLRTLLKLPAFTISATKNKFIAIGCDNYAKITGFRGEIKIYEAGCGSMCDRLEDVNFESCSGNGCCQITSIPNGLDTLAVLLSSSTNHTNVWSFNPCGYASLADETQFEFSNVCFQDFQNMDVFPIVLDWTIGNFSCDQALSLGNLSCTRNSRCVDSEITSGYLCQCLPGFEGNPYHPEGCQDIDECKNSSSCVNGECINTHGSFNCSCQKGYQLINRSFCTKIGRKPRRQLIFFILLGVIIGLIALAVPSSIIYWGVKKTKRNKLKEKFFEQNGGFMLREQLFSHGGTLDRRTTKIFTEEELKRATNDYHESRILGKGGYGIVYRGILPDQRVVAIKKSKNVAQIQTEQFVNELVILMQVNHKNVVKLLGCCLETEVPLLVYEFITNGTLYQHIHKSKEVSSLSWDLRLKIAKETAEALAYLHSQTNTPIVHRDVKTANILLDENYAAKVSDFGASRLIPLDKNQLSTFVQGTLGYLDPEYMQSSQLTKNSDVYSFGVVLAELLTSMRAVSFDRPDMDRNLAMHFVCAIKEDRLLQILDSNIVNDENINIMKDVAYLVERCLRVKGEERPSMKEVLFQLEGLMKKVDSCSVTNNDRVLSDQTQHLNPYWMDIFHDCSSKTKAAFYSMENEMLNSFGTYGR